MYKKKIAIVGPDKGRLNIVETDMSFVIEN